ITFGCCYDLLSGLRMELHFLTFLLDILMGLAVLFGNWLLFLYGGEGTYRLFFLPGTILGFYLWKWTLSRGFRRISGLLWRCVFFPFGILHRILGKIIEKTKIFLKNPFSKWKKSVRIKRQHSVNGGEGGA
ncbi:MAG: spore cortex biosynthesis protein YabQ, partial [Oscillospiraceae bacterium]|nr:spore cortex biosynthesis protein YabQ [Oscillospiraceae bacterium]